MQDEAHLRAGVSAAAIATKRYSRGERGATWEGQWAHPLRHTGSAEKRTEQGTRAAAVAMTERRMNTLSGRNPDDAGNRVQGGARLRAGERRGEKFKAFAMHPNGLVKFLLWTLPSPSTPDSVGSLQVR